MKATLHNQRGFTLVEIMIVVVIIGLLTAMAIPLWSKIRQNTMRSRMDNDGRQIAAAAQQYFLDTNETTVSTGWVESGAIGTPLSSWVKQVSAGYTQFPDTLVIGGAFTIEHPLAAGSRTYCAEGQRQ